MLQFSEDGGPVYRIGSGCSARRSLQIAGDEPESPQCDSVVGEEVLNGGDVRLAEGGVLQL